jgi:RNA recognition motif-containing protein
MGTSVFVGNLSYQTDEDQLRALFESNGANVVRVHIVTDRETGRPRGFGFVEMDSDEAARAAIEAFDGHELGGRNLRVNEANERPKRGGGGGGGRY